MTQEKTLVIFVLYLTFGCINSSQMRNISGQMCKSYIEISVKL